MQNISVQQALINGVNAHRAGKIDEAETIYNAILVAHPDHPDANHNMGILLKNKGLANNSLKYFQKAIEIKPSVSQFWVSILQTLIDLNDTSEAERLFEEVERLNLTDDRFLKLKTDLGATASNRIPSKETRSNETTTNDKQGLEQRLRTAKKLYKTGHHDEAFTIFKQLAEKYPRNKRIKVETKKILKNPSDSELTSLEREFNNGKYIAFLQSVELLLNKYPTSAKLHNFRGVAHLKLGQLMDALTSYTNAIKYAPNFMAAHYNLGITYKNLHQGDLAAESFINAIRISPENYDAYYNLANTQVELSQFEDAILNYNQALKINPNFADAYVNRGNALLKLGKLQLALESYEAAIKIKPDYPMAHSNCGNVLYKLGLPNEALDRYLTALLHQAESPEVYQNIAVVLTSCNFEAAKPELNTVIIELLRNYNFCRPIDIAQVALSLVKLEPKVRECIELTKTGASKDDLPFLINNLSTSNLLIELMQATPLPDLEIENLLTKIRTLLLHTNLKGAFCSKFNDFQSALARQCFINEYIFDTNEQETLDLIVLKTKIKQAFQTKKQPSPSNILTLACYQCLCDFDFMKELKCTPEIKDVFIQQVSEPENEKQIRNTIVNLGNITDEVSQKVKEQYEESPYPRWVKAAKSVSRENFVDICEREDIYLIDKTLLSVEKPKILVAGCGTGQQPIELSFKFKDAQITAIDLSLSSLAYAKRKTEELGINNIEYFYADLKNAQTLKEEFDIIECMGVLHHMNEPFEGWDALVKVLKPGGLMKIGLYSELARQSVVKVRNEIQEIQYSSSRADILKMRRLIAESSNEHHVEITRSPDFYSTSNLRDLLFHVQESRFTIELIKEYLTRLNLSFCGFQSGKIVSQFQKHYTNSSDLVDLGKWGNFEERFPNAFAGMYQFYCQK